MKFLVWWTGDAGSKVDIGPYSLANAIDSALDYEKRGAFLYITDGTGRRLTIRAAKSERRCQKVLEARGAPPT